MCNIYSLLQFEPLGLAALPSLRSWRVFLEMLGRCQALLLRPGEVASLDLALQLGCYILGISPLLSNKNLKAYSSLSQLLPI